ncbi:uncharacterized protein LOC108212421 [Daucus carota subsp. sativus]|uniref:uncharacterized protein LOC108212421 n=1 Tax=Daucus carota subsp. sativus TaxID=79200 RepID=UPI003082CD14
MSSVVCDDLRDLKAGRTDWQIKVRIIRQWRGITVLGEPFKGYNYMFLDAKNCRMQAYVPQSLEVKFNRLVVLGKIYFIKKFQVKDYTEKDKYRPVRMDKQISLTNDTKIKDLEDSDFFIPKNMFDFVAFSQLKELATQHVYLAGVICKEGKFTELPERNGKPHCSFRFKISDGRKKVNVTFWDSMARDFDAALTSHPGEKTIVIIASAKVSAWQGNYAPTTFYINYDHHSVNNLKKMLNQPQFSHLTSTTKPKTYKLCTIDQIKKLNAQYIDVRIRNEDEVLCKANLKFVEETEDWKQYDCTSCYSDCSKLDGRNHRCSECNRIVADPLERFKISAVISDDTGGLQVTLFDREVRTLLGKTVQQVQTKDNSFPKIIKNIQGKNCTFQLLIAKENIDNNDSVYCATNIALGFDVILPTVQEQAQETQSDIQTAQPSGSSYHLDNISQLDYEQASN